MKTIPIERRSLHNLIYSLGFFSKECPFFLEISKNGIYNKILHELLLEKEIFKLTIKGEEVYLSRPMFLKYLITSIEPIENIKKHYNFLENEINEVINDLNVLLNTPNIVFDLGGVIADESDLDVKICEYIDMTADWRNTNWRDYEEYSNWLANNKNPKWYDYFAQASELGISENVINTLHENNLTLVKFYEFASEFIRYLFEKGHKIFFITGCNSKVLSLRLKLYKLDKYVSGYITSDTGGEIGNKEPYYFEFFKRYNLTPSECILFTDNYFKDGLPANKYHLKNMLFIEGGRSNPEFNSNGIQPDDLAIISLLASNEKNSPDLIFSSFKKLYNFLVINQSLMKS